MNLPRDFLNRMKTQLGDEFDAFCAEYSNIKTHGLRVNTLKLSVNDFLKIFNDNLKPVPWCASGFYVNTDKNEISYGASPFHRAGLFYMQEPSAMAVAQTVSPNENDRVLDLCAAPGGKSTHLAALMKNVGILISNEIVPKRAKILSENIERLGVSNTIVTNENPDNLCSHFKGFFDKVLVDAPCSGEGMFRKEPCAIAEWSIEHTKSCARRQLLILQSATQALKEGAELTYSTCTFSPDENEGVISEFLKENSDFELINAQHMYPHTHMCEGHFIAKLRHKGDFSPSKPQKTVSDVSELEGIVCDTKYHNIIRMGDHLWSAPEIIDARGIKFLRYGLHLGEFKKNRFEPSHSLCMAANDFCQKISIDDSMLEEYLHGNVIPCSSSGWVAVNYKGFNIGLGKASCGVLKNHLPKSLRKV